MADMEKVIKGIQECDLNGGRVGNCPYKDILFLLKEQQQKIEALEIDIDILAKDINTNNCNTCKRQCEHRPEPGDVVRVNCFMWEGN